MCHHIFLSFIESCPVVNKSLVLYLKWDLFTFIHSYIYININKTYIRFSCNVDSSFLFKDIHCSFYFSQSLLRFNKLFICFYFVCNLYVNAIKVSVYNQIYTHTWNNKAMVEKFYRSLIEFIHETWGMFSWRVNAILDF